MRAREPWRKELPVLPACTEASQNMSSSSKEGGVQGRRGFPSGHQSTEVQLHDLQHSWERAGEQAIGRAGRQRRHRRRSGPEATPSAGLQETGPGL